MGPSIRMGPKRRLQGYKIAKAADGRRSEMARPTARPASAMRRVDGPASASMMPGRRPFPDTPSCPRTRLGTSA